MASLIGQRINRHRKKLKMTQDQMGSKYGVSGPAIFKFEKGYVVPSLDLWLRIAKDMGIEERAAVLMHVQEKVPEPHRSVLGLSGVLEEEKFGGPEYENFSRYRNAEKLRKAVLANQWLPAGLLEFANSAEMWALYQPTGDEINLLRDFFAPLGDGAARDFCDALRLVREFRGQEG